MVPWSILMCHRQMRDVLAELPLSKSFKQPPSIELTIVLKSVLLTRCPVEIKYYKIKSILMTRISKFYVLSTRCDLVTFLSHLLLILNSSSNIVIYCWKVNSEKITAFDQTNKQANKPSPNALLKQQHCHLLLEGQINNLSLKGSLQLT